MRFHRWVLRTTDVEGGRAFYRAVFGEDFWSDPLEVSPLPDQARARGAPAHWLGYLEGDGERCLARGATVLGPRTSNVFRDPFGAVFGLASGAPPSIAVTSTLHSTDAEAAFSWYEALFGADRSRFFDTARLEGVHPQWMHAFRVPDFGAAVKKVKELGGLVVGTLELPSGARMAPCDDIQGAAFGIYAD